MPDGNPLVADAPQDGDGPGPFTAGNGEFGYAGGIGIAESAIDTFNGIKDGDWVQGGLGVLGLAAEGAAAAIDPFGWLMSSVASFLMEHIQPLKDMLDSVCGDPPVIQSYSETWGNVATRLEETQADFANAVKTGTSGWTGGGANAYRDSCREQEETLAGAASVAGSVSTVVMIMGEVVGFVRETVRDLIADLVGKLISWVLETVFSLGFGTPVVVAQAVTAISKWATKIADLLKRLLETIRRVSPLLGKLGDILAKIVKVSGRIAGKVTGLDVISTRNIKGGGFFRHGGIDGPNGGPSSGNTSGSGDGDSGSGSGSGSDSGADPDSGTTTADPVASTSSPTSSTPSTTTNTTTSTTSNATQNGYSSVRTDTTSHGTSDGGNSTQGDSGSGTDDDSGGNGNGSGNDGGSGSDGSDGGVSASHQRATPHTGNANGDAPTGGNHTTGNYTTSNHGGSSDSGGTSSDGGGPGAHTSPHTGTTDTIGTGAGTGSGSDSISNTTSTSGSTPAPTPVSATPRAEGPASLPPQRGPEGGAPPHANAPMGGGAPGGTGQPATAPGTRRPGTGGWTGTPGTPPGNAPGGRPGPATSPQPQVAARGHTPPTGSPHGSPHPGRPSRADHDTPQHNRPDSRSGDSRGDGPAADPQHTGDGGAPHSPDPLTPDQVNQRHADPTPAGTSYHRGDPDLGDLPQRVPPDPGGRYTADVHVTPEGHARIGDRHYTPEQFADILRRNGDYDGGPVRLIGCDAGSNDFAQRLARELDADVLAPNTKAWTDSNGRVFSSDVEIGPDGKLRPRIPPNGEWTTHHPDGTTTGAGDDAFSPDTPGERKRDLDGDDARARGASGDDENPQHQIEGRWREPDHLPFDSPEDGRIRLDDDSSLFDEPRRDLEPGRRYEIMGEDGDVRSTVYTDSSGNVTHVDAVAPNTLHGGNPEVMRPAPDADYRVRTGHRADIFPTGPDGRTRMVDDPAGGPSRVDYVDVPEEPAAVRNIGPDDDLCPGGDTRFGEGHSLDPSTRYNVVDAEGNPRGTFQTDGEGNVKWADVPGSGNGWDNPDLREPHPNANYRVDKGPMHQEYHVGGDGRPEPAAPWDGPERDTLPRQDHPGVKQGEAFSARQGTENLAPGTEHRALDERGQVRSRFYTDGDGNISHVDAESGQRGRTNPEVSAAPDGARVVQDGRYGTPAQQNVRDDWPAPDREITYSHQQRPEGFAGGKPESYEPKHEAALGDRDPGKPPVVGRRNLPPDSRIEILDTNGNPYATIQTDGKGKPTHIHTADAEEIAKAKKVKGVQVVEDPGYGTQGARNPRSEWPDPEHDVRYSYKKEPVGFDGAEPDRLSARERDALTADPKKTPLAGREGLPPDSRVTLLDKDGKPYTTVQTDAGGNVKHVHTYKPFDADLNNPPPSATVRVDERLHVPDGNGGTRVHEGDVHRTDENGNTVATTSRPEYSDGGNDIRRDGTAQRDVGAEGGRSAKGTNLDEGGHHGGTETGKAGERINQSTQSTSDNRMFPGEDAGKKTIKTAPDHDSSASYYAMERARDEARNVEVEDIMPMRDSGQADPHTRQYRSIGVDDRNRPTVTVRSFANDHNAPLWTKDFRDREPTA
ncbi:hypothetical protein ABZ639_25525 [Saccharomonospora sp. NPDC006951]